MKKELLGVVMAAGMIAALTGCGKSAAVKANADANGNYLVNGSFEEADFTGWTVTNIDNVTEELNIYDRDTDCFDGVQSLMEPPIKNSSQYGDQYATVQIQVPKHLSEEAKQKLREYVACK